MVEFPFNSSHQVFVLQKGSISMKYTVLGFNQEKVVEYGLEVKDLLLIDYIWDMLGSPTTQHIVQDNCAYVWLRHDRILADLPILKISRRSLIDYLNKLKDLGLVAVVTVNNEKTRGSKSYYTITEKCEALRYDQVQKIAVSQRPSAENCTSDNINPYNTNIPSNNTSKQDIFILEEESKKENKAKQFVDDYNAICKSLPKCIRMTAKRSKGITNILKKFSYEEILQVFNNLEASDFCKGKNDRGWRADIDFILREDKFVAVLEGRYTSSTRRNNVEKMTASRVTRVSDEERERIKKYGTKF